MFGGWLPFCGLLCHTGRTSGKIYLTRVLVFKTLEGYIVPLGYGLRTQWLKNVQAAGYACIRLHGKWLYLGHPRIISKYERLGLALPSLSAHRVFSGSEYALLLSQCQLCTSRETGHA